MRSLWASHLHHSDSKPLPSSEWRAVVSILIYYQCLPSCLRLATDHVHTTPDKRSQLTPAMHLLIDKAHTKKPTPPMQKWHQWRPSLPQASKGPADSCQPATGRQAHSLQQRVRPCSPVHTALTASASHTCISAGEIACVLCYVCVLQVLLHRFCTINRLFWTCTATSLHY